MRNRSIILFAAVCMAAVLALQGAWLHHTWQLTRDDMKERREELERQASAVLAQAVEIHAKELLKTTPKGTRIEGKKHASDVPSVTLLVEGLERLGYPLSLRAVDSVAAVLMQKEGIGMRHEVRRAEAADSTHVFYTRADKSAGIRLILGYSAESVLERMKYILLATAVMTFLALAGWAYLLHITLTHSKLLRLKEDYGYAMAHGMKTPLCTARICSELLGMERVRSNPELQRKHSRLLQDSIDRLQENVHRILSAYTLEYARMRVHREAVELRPLVDELAERLLASDGGKRITLRTELHAESVPAQPDLLRSALECLLDNSVKYASTLSVEILVTSEASEGGTVLRVADNGRGIARADRRRIFRRFERGSGGGGTPGFGLGLSFVRDIMRAHGGKVTLRSREGHGAEFSLWFPG